MAQFPGSEASFTGFTSGHTLAADSHASQHNSEQAEITATQHKIGTGSSTPTSGLLLRGSGVGTSAWAQVGLTTDVSGVLPQANGGTGTTLATGTGKAVYDTSPTISGASLTSSPTLTTPTIADFTNATHTHGSAAQGGQIANAGISGVGAEKLSNPYKFFAYLTATVNLTSTQQTMPFDSKLFDTNNNFSLVTHKYTAPVAGYYWFQAQTYINALADQANMSLFLITSTFSTDSTKTSSGANDLTNEISTIVNLAAGATVEIQVANSQGARNWLGTTAAGGTQLTFFQGYLVSTT